MSVEKRNLFPVGPNQAASSADGSSVASAFDPNTGERNPSYKAPMPSAAPDTTGARGGLGQSAAGAADAHAYRVATQAYSRIQSNEGAGGFGSTIRGDSDDAFSTTGSHADGVPMTAIAGEDHLVIREGGADSQPDSGQSGGRSISY